MDDHEDGPGLEHVARACAIMQSAVEVMRDEGRNGTFSRMIRRMLSKPWLRSSFGSKGSRPVSNSYNITPRA